MEYALVIYMWSALIKGMALTSISGMTFDQCQKNIEIAKEHGADNAYCLQVK